MRLGTLPSVVSCDLVAAVGAAQPHVAIAISGFELSVRRKRGFELPAAPGSDRETRTTSSELGRGIHITGHRCSVTRDVVMVVLAGEFVIEPLTPIDPDRIE